MSSLVRDAILSHMTYELAKTIYEKMNTTKLEELLDDLVKYASNYARIRADWREADADRRREMDAHRTITHNALLDACKILARNQVKAGESTEWRELLGDQRAEIGDFACYLHCFRGLEGR